MPVKKLYSSLISVFVSKRKISVDATPLGAVSSATRILNAAHDISNRRRRPVMLLTIVWVILFSLHWNTALAEDPLRWTCDTVTHDVSLDAPSPQRSFDPCEVLHLLENSIFEPNQFVRNKVESQGWTMVHAEPYKHTLEHCWETRNNFALTMEVSDCYVVDAGQADPGLFYPEGFNIVPIPTYDRPFIRFIYKSPPAFGVIQSTWYNAEICDPKGTRDLTNGYCIPPPDPRDDKNNGDNPQPDPLPDTNTPRPDVPGSPVPNIPCLFGNPCNPANGNKYQREEDLTVPGTGLSFVRSYNSLFRQDIGLGFGWTSSTQTRLEINSVDPSSVIARRSNGAAQVFTCKLTGKACATDDDGVLILTKLASGYTLKYPLGSSDQYDTAGRLTVRTDPSGNSVTYSYDAQGRLSSVTGPYGHMLSFSYDTSGHLSSVVDPAGRTVSYSYDAKFNLVRVTYPDGSFRTYHYENTRFPHHLTGITDEKGVRYSR